MSEPIIAGVLGFAVGWAANGMMAFWIARDEAKRRCAISATRNGEAMP